MKVINLFKAKVSRALEALETDKDKLVLAREELEEARINQIESSRAIFAQNEKLGMKYKMAENDVKYLIELGKDMKNKGMSDSDPEVLKVCREIVNKRAIVDAIKPSFDESQKLRLDAENKLRSLDQRIAAARSKIDVIESKMESLKMLEVNPAKSVNIDNILDKVDNLDLDITSKFNAAVATNSILADTRVDTLNYASNYNDLKAKEVFASL